MSDTMFKIIESQANQTIHFYKIRQHSTFKTSISDARVLPWRVIKWYKESILAVADWARKEVSEEHGFYLVALDGGGNGRIGGVKVERGSTLIEKGLKQSLGTVVMVVWPPKEDVDDQFSDEETE